MLAEVASGITIVVSTFPISSLPTNIPDRSIHITPLAMIAAKACRRWSADIASPVAEFAI
jgi:hypothetical protein